MNRYCKAVLFPLVLIVRLIRRIKNNPSRRVKSLFAYDCARFVRYAGSIAAPTRGALLARIIMAYHVLEKGITMPRRHLGFGRAAVLDLISQIERFEAQFGREEAQVDHAVGVVKEYYAAHQEAHFDMSTDAEYWGRIEQFCMAHSAVPSSAQVTTTREAFFSHNEDPFPLFAASRHTSRYYEGVVEVERIMSAVELAMTAPSACNRQFIKVYCVSNHEKRDAVLALQNGNRGFGMDADKLLVITADLAGDRWMEERNDLYTNAGIFIMNLCYALHYHKVAHCILNWSVKPEQDREAHTVLAVPESEAIAAILSCGNAPERFMVAASPRKHVRDIFREVQ